MQIQNPISKKILKNGLTILVHKNNVVPEVACHIFYNIGSKHETENKRGLAHAVEHMILKGTKNLSETDFAHTIFKITGSFNAFTTKDYTQFLVTIPNTQIREFFILAQEIMSSAAFKADILDAEIRALVQEASIAQDNYDQILREELTSTIFKEHAYHFATRGNKFDISQFTPEDLHSFYHAHYTANNAVIVFVGAVDPETIFNLAELFLGNIPNQVTWTAPSAQTFHLAEDQFEYYKRDTVSRSTVIYRNIAVPRVKLAYIIPGTQTDLETVELLCYILAQNRTARLYKKLVVELELVEFLNASHSNLRDPNIFYVVFKPRAESQIGAIIDIIQNEIAALTHDISDEAINTALLSYHRNNFMLAQDNTSLAEYIGDRFLATGAVSQIALLTQAPTRENINKLRLNIQQLLANYTQPFNMHTGIALPFDSETRTWWRLFQKEDDAHDSEIFGAHNRVTQLEPTRFTQTVNVHPLPRFICPVPNSLELSNGLRVLYFDSKRSPTITIVIQLNINCRYDPEKLHGLSNVLQLLLSQDTSGEKFGVSVNSDNFGLSINLVRDALEPALKLLQKILTEPDCNQKIITRLKHHCVYKLHEFWTYPESFGEHIIKQKLFAGQPFTKNYLGTQEDIERITPNALINYFKKYITPETTRIAIVGDLENYDIENLCNNYLSAWTADTSTGTESQDISEIVQKPLEKINAETSNYYFDQSLVHIIIGARTLDSTDARMDQLCIFDQFFTGNYSRNNISELFKIRDHQGIFYTFDGSLVQYAGGIYNMLYLQTQTLLISAELAQEAIKKALAHAPETFGQAELEQARKALLFSVLSQFETDENMAKAFLSFGMSLHKNYYREREEKLHEIKLGQVHETVRTVLRSNPLITLKIGRVT